MKWCKCIRNKSIFHQLVILIIGIIILPMILANSIVLSFLVENLHEEYDKLIKITAYTSKNIMQDTISRIIDSSISVIGSQKVRDYLTEERTKELLSRYFLAQSNIELYLQNNKFVTNIWVSSIDGEKQIMSGVGSTNFFSYEEKQRMLMSNGAWFWSKQKNNKYAICRLIRDKNNMENKIGFMKIFLDEDAINRQLYSNSERKSYQFVLLDKLDDQVVFSTSEEVGILIQKVYEENIEELRKARNYTLQKDHQYIIFSRIGTRSLDIVTIVEDQTIYYIVMKYGIILLLLFLFVLTAMIYAGIYRKRITNPLDALNKSMKNLDSSNGAPPRVQIDAKGEIKELVDSYNMMAERLDYLYDTNYKNELKLRDANLLVLQSEINPHFLYNVLDSIRWMIEMEKNKEAAGMVWDLSQMFRQTLKLSDCNVIYLEEELEHVKNYISIEKYRFRDKINFQFNIQEGLEKAQVVKFIIQPLVENAVVHGISKSASGYGTVLVSIYSRRQELIYDIRDNGVGADEIRIAEILDGKIQKKNSLEGFALENIQSRLRLRYGKKYGLIYQKREEGGSVLIVKQPLIFLEDSENVKIDDCR